MNNLRHQVGITLVEILVTITITSIGMMGLVSMQLQALKATQDSGNHGQAIWLFNDISSRIKANAAASHEYITDNDAPYVCANLPTPCSYYGLAGDGIVLAAECTGQQLAEWDLFETACTIPVAGNIINGSADYLPRAELTITCADGINCTPGDHLLVNLEWRARLADAEITGAARQAGDDILRIQRVVKP